MMEWLQPPLQDEVQIKSLGAGVSLSGVGLPLPLTSCVCVAQRSALSVPQGTQL